MVGARPQFVKAAVISRNIRSKFRHFEEIMVHTGQHFDENMSDIFFENLEITKPKYFLNINNLSHGAMIGKMIMELEKIFLKEKPSCIILYGDTNSTLAAGLAGKKLNIKIAHIEAGVRNYDESMPEESNRYLVDRLSDFNFCCTELGFSNLADEGFNLELMNKKFYLTGDVMYDAALFESERKQNLSLICQNIIQEKKDFVLATIHRPSNTDSEMSLSAIINDLNAINSISRVIFLAHPRTKDKLSNFDIKPDFEIFEPLGYFDTIQLIKSSETVITDSGGLVREAYFFKTKSLFLLSNPVWPELIDANACINICPSEGKIFENYNLLRSQKVYWDNKIFGDGCAGEEILEILSKELS